MNYKILKPPYSNETIGFVLTTIEKKLPENCTINQIHYKAIEKKQILSRSDKEYSSYFKSVTFHQT